MPAELASRVRLHRRNVGARGTASWPRGAPDYVTYHEVRSCGVRRRARRGEGGGAAGGQLTARLNARRSDDDGRAPPFAGALSHSATRSIDVAAARAKGWRAGGVAARKHTTCGVGSREDRGETCDGFAVPTEARLGIAESSLQLDKRMSNPMILTFF